MKILNLYAGIGGNRKLWEGHEIHAVEIEADIARAYKKLFPGDRVIIEDAHQYLLEHFQEYDFIWSSPPCPSHSKLRLAHPESICYPDMKLYEEIILLKHFFKGFFCIENVVGYYDPLIQPSAIQDRHFFWSNFDIPSLGRFENEADVSRATKDQLAKLYGIDLPEGLADQRKLLRNAVDPRIGKMILDAIPWQLSLLEGEL